MAQQLYGRADLVDRVARSEAPLTLLTGDSGVGKTRVLEAAADERAGWLNARPRRFAASTSSVRQGFLDALGDAVAELAAERGIAEIGDRLAGAAERMIAENIKELGRALGAELLEIVRGRLGPESGRAITQFIKKLREEMDSTVAARIASAADEDIAAVLASLAGEVVRLAEGRRLGLFFDAGERLNEEESRLLVDVAERLPGNVYVRVAFATYGPRSADRVATLRLLAETAHEIEVEPLVLPDVRAWVVGADVDADPADVLRASNGYPLHIGDVIGHLQSGGSLDDAPLNQLVSRRAEMSWNELSSDASRIARRLCVLEDPLPEERLREMVGADAASYGQGVDELVRGRIFLNRVDGRPWFHEQRRMFVRRKLGSAELDEAATCAAEAVWSELCESNEPRQVVQFALLAAEATTLQQREPKIAAVLALDDSELAVLAALAELVTAQHLGASADDLFRHARHFAEAAVDPVSTLASLESADLVVTASNEHSTAVVPAFDGRVLAVVTGRGYRILKRPPIPQLANLVLEVGLRPALGAFTKTAFGMGRPSIGGLARSAGGGDPEPGYRSKSPNRRRPGLHVLGRGRYAQRPVWFVATYDDLEERESAYTKLSTLRVDVYGDELVIEDAFRHPLEVVPAQRFVKAAARATGLTSFGVRDTEDIRLETDTAVSTERSYELRVETARVIRQRSSLLERHAMELDGAFGLYWDARDDARLECTVYGGLEQAQRVSGLLDSSIHDRYGFFQTERRLQLGSLARLQNITGHWGKSGLADPVFAELARRRQRAHAFNSAQPPRRTVLDAQTLEPMIRDGFCRLKDDARALAPLMVRETVELRPSALFVYVLLEQQTNGWMPGCGSRVIAIERENDVTEDEVFFALSQGGVDTTGILPQATGDIVALFSAAFGFAPESSHGFVLGNRAHDVASLLSEYAGLSEGDVALRWADQEW